MNGRAEPESDLRLLLTLIVTERMENNMVSVILWAIGLVQAKAKVVIKNFAHESRRVGKLKRPTPSEA